MNADSILDFMLHIDVHLNQLIANYGIWSYAILFTIVFAETGLVVAPFLPGDSLLFAAGALAASGSLDPLWLFMTLSIAAIAGNTTNYWIGAAIGPGVFRKGGSRFINERYLAYPRLLRAPWREDDCHREIPANHSNIRPVRGRHRIHGIQQVHVLQRRGGDRLGRDFCIRRLSIRQPTRRQKPLHARGRHDRRHLPPSGSL